MRVFEIRTFNLSDAQRERKRMLFSKQRVKYETKRETNDKYQVTSDRTELSY